ncbi:MAG: hypothetical protein JWR22_1225 [Herminiimonas sp.]|nr:hypothetical protein [Herminiimonas sp.]
MKSPSALALQTEISGSEADAATDRAAAIDFILQAFESSTDRETVVETALHHARDVSDSERSLVLQDLVTQFGQTMDHAYWHRPHQRRWRA